MEEQGKAVRAMQVYIREHITEDITPADLAKASNFSPWYARKLFIKNLGMAPAVYIRRLRLSMSALRLRDEKIAILDIAMEMGFGSVDGPAQLRKEVESTTLVEGTYVLSPFLCLELSGQLQRGIEQNLVI